MTLSGGPAWPQAVADAKSNEQETTSASYVFIRSLLLHPTEQRRRRGRDDIEAVVPLGADHVVGLDDGIVGLHAEAYRHLADVEGLVDALDWPVDLVIGTSLDKDSVEIRECIRDEKELRIKNDLKHYNIDIKKTKITSYGNLPDDLNMFGISDNYYVVKNGVVVAN